MKIPKHPTQKELQDAVDLFNYRFNVGEKVLVKTDGGESIHDTISHKATIMGGHSAMTWLENKGSYSLDRVSKL